MSVGVGGLVGGVVGPDSFWLGSTISTNHEIAHWPPTNLLPTSHQPPTNLPPTYYCYLTDCPCRWGVGGLSVLIGGVVDCWARSVGGQWLVSPDQWVGPDQWGVSGLLRLIGRLLSLIDKLLGLIGGLSGLISGGSGPTVRGNSLLKSGLLKSPRSGPTTPLFRRVCSVCTFSKC